MQHRSFCIFLLMFVSHFLMMAQQYEVRGKVVYQSNGEIVEFATVGLSRMDSSLVTSTHTSDNGTFKMVVTKAGDYLLKVSFVGCRSYFRKVKLSARVPRCDVGEVKLAESDHLLGEAVIKTVLSKVEQKEDTTIFNAAAYRVPEGSTLEALVKQLPGVEVAEDGSITINGKKVTELLVNGEDFFKGDNQVAMKNLPSNLVSKVKTYDKKSDYTEETGIEDGEEKKVLDITTKTKLDHSWISNIDLAYGTEDRYSADLFLSRFTERSRVSAYASIGNVDKYGYGGSGGGLTTSKSGGIDFSWKNDKAKREAGKLELGGSTYYNYNGTDMLSTTASETFLTSGKSSSFSNSLRQSSNSSAYFGTNLRMEWTIDSMTNLKFRPSFSHSQGDNDGLSRTATFNEDPYGIPGMVNPLDSLFQTVPNTSLKEIAVNRNGHQSLGNSNSTTVSGELSFLRRLNSKGRNISLKAKGSYRESKSKSFSMSDIQYYNGHDSHFLNQYSHTPSENWDYNVRLGYAEPFSEKLVGEVRYTYGVKFNSSDRSRYNLDSLGGRWADMANHPFLGTLPTAADSLAMVRDSMNSQYATYKYYDHNIDLSLQYKTEKVRLNVGVELNPEKTKMAYDRPGQHIDTIVSRDVLQIRPDIRFRYRFSPEQSIDFRYRGYSSQPSMTDLLAVVDNSNPLSVTMGNPGLKPSWTNSVSASYWEYENKSQRSINTGIDYVQTGRTVSHLLVYDESTGVRYTRPQNIDGNWSSSAYFMFNTGLGKEKYFSVSTYSHLNYRNDVGYVSSFTSSETTRQIETPHERNDVEHYNDIFNGADIKKSITRSWNWMQNLKLSYQKDWCSVALKGGLRYNHSRSKLQERGDMDTWNYNYAAHLDFDFDSGFSISTDIGMNSRRGYSDATMNSNELLWNAQLSHSFLKQKAATLSLKFYDILHEKSNVSRRIDAMNRVDSWTNGVNSYCMLHFVYKLNIFPAKKTGDK